MLVVWSAVSWQLAAAMGVGMPGFASCSDSLGCADQRRTHGCGHVSSALCNLAQVTYHSSYTWTHMLTLSSLRCSAVPAQWDA